MATSTNDMKNSLVNTTKKNIKRNRNNYVFDYTTMDETPVSQPTETTTYKTVIPTGNHGNETYKAPSQTQNVVDSNKSFRDADAELSAKLEEKAEREERIRKLNEQMQSQTEQSESGTTTEQRNRGFGEFSLSSSKSARYREIASNLSTLSADYAKKAGETQAGFNIFNGAWGGITTALTAINPWLGVASAGIGALINLGNNSGKQQEESANYAQMQQNMVSYLTNLTNRDTTIMNTMDSIYSSMDNMRGTYGSSFVDQMYNYYLVQSGMTSDAYSMLTGNFTNFELGNGKYGNMSAEGGVFDTLTDGNQGMFNNIYAQLQMGDLSSNTKLMDSLVQSLYGANTEFGISLRGYETDLRTALQQSMIQQSQYMFGARSDLASLGASGRSENISATESIGSAEADQATSGLRGGTTANNANLARLQRDLGIIQRNAQTASVIGTLKYNIQNAQLNASSTAYSYRSAQRKAVAGALNDTISAWNSIGRTAQAGERESNYYIDEAKSNKRQFEEGFNNIRDDADKDKFLEAASN